MVLSGPCSFTPAPCCVEDVGNAHQRPKTLLLSPIWRDFRTQGCSHSRGALCSTATDRSINPAALGGRGHMGALIRPPCVHLAVWLALLLGLAACLEPSGIAGLLRVEVSAGAWDTILNCGSSHLPCNRDMPGGVRQVCNPHGVGSQKQYGHHLAVLHGQQVLYTQGSSCVTQHATYTKQITPGTVGDRKQHACLRLAGCCGVHP